MPRRVSKLKTCFRPPVIVAGRYTFFKCSVVCSAYFMYFYSFKLHAILFPPKYAERTGVWLSAVVCRQGWASRFELSMLGMPAI